MKKYQCNIDGDYLCIFNDDFIDLQVSDAVFIKLIPVKIREIKKILGD